MSNSTCFATPTTTIQPGLDARAAEPVIPRLGVSTSDPNEARSSPSASSAESSGWTPRLGASHLFKGASGIWYMRLVVPAHIRARHPELPKELKRSTKVALKSLALAKAREMCLDFFVKYGSGAPMLTLDEKTDQSFALFYENGKVRIDHSHSANAETLTLMQSCFNRMMEQVVARGRRSAGQQPMPEVQAAVLPAVHAVAPPVPPV